MNSVEKSSCIKSIYDPPADDLIADADDWDHARWHIQRTIPTLDYEEAPEFYSGGISRLPVLSGIKNSLAARLKAAGIDEHENSDSVSPDMKATLLALQSMKQIEALLFKNGTADMGAIKVCLLTTDMIVSVLRSGLLPKMIDDGKKAGNMRSQGGLTKAQQDHDRHNQWQKDAEKIWKSRRTLSKRNVSFLLEKRYNDNDDLKNLQATQDAISRRIKKPA